MTYRMLASGLVAGFAAGLFAALLHFAFIQPVLLTGEQYETGALVHFTAEASSGSANALAASASAPAAAEGHGEHGEAASSLQRNLLTVLFTGLTYAAYGLFVAAGFGLARHLGHRVTLQAGLLWGLAGFVSLQLAPALGLPPELPGTITAELEARQIWWLATVVATALGLGLLAHGRGGVAAWVAAAVLLAAPHIVGAPQPDRFWGVAPPELASMFAARALGVGLLAWLALGWISARMWVSTAE